MPEQEAMKNGKSFAKLAFLSIALFVGVSGVLTGAETSAKDAVSAALAFDWRAFLAPFHSVILHLPIGFVSIALILEIYSLFNPGKSLRRAIGLVLWVSALSAIVAALLGYLRGAGGGYEKNALAFHQWTGIAVTVSIGLAAFIHLIAFPRNSKRRLFFASVYRLVLLVTVALLSIAGHYGGNLTHGSKYLFENAPEWVGTWVKETESKVHDKIAEKTGLELAPETPADDAAGEGGSGIYAETLRPVFEKKCFQCHGPEKQKGGYRMDTVEGLFAQGDSELDPIVAGRPLESYLVEMITLPTEDDLVMPPDGKDPLTPEETLAVVRWIWSGAETGAGKDPEPEKPEKSEEAATSEKTAAE